MVVARAEWGVEGGHVPGLILLRIPHHHPHTGSSTRSARDNGLDQALPGRGVSAIPTRRR